MSVQIILAFTATIVIVFILMFIYLMRFLQKKLNISDELIRWLQDTSRKVEFSSSSIDTKLTSTVNEINTRIDKTMSALADVQKTFGEFSELGKTVKDVSLLFRNPKGRGSLGEALLESIIKDILPKEAYEFQHRFKNGDIVDAIVKTGSIIVPIDSKFPMENFVGESKEKLFNRDVRKHIDDVSKKYIRPEEHTTDYALLYIPSETVFYEVIGDEVLSNYAQSKRVMLTSPMSLYMYLKAIFMSYQGQRIQERSRDIIGALNGLIHDFEVVKNNYDVLNKHISHTYKQSHVVNESLEKAEKQILSISRMNNKQIEGNN